MIIVVHEEGVVHLKESSDCWHTIVSGLNIISRFVL